MTAVLGIGAAGCAGKPTPARSSTVAHAPTVLRGFGQVFRPAVVQAFNRSHSTVQLQFGSGSGVEDDLFEQSVAGLASQFVPLESTLKSSNLDTATVPQAAWNAFTYDGHLWAVPFTQWVWGLLWREDAFKSARLSAPTADWTIADLEAACVELTKLAKSGDQAGLGSALGPLIPVDNRGEAAGQAGLWESFALGYGGALTDAGRVDLSSAATLAGLSTFIDLSRRFASKAVPPPFGRSIAKAAAASWALQFAPLTGVLLPTPFLVNGFRYGSEWKWARMPRFPVAPVILTSLSGAGLLRPPPAQTAPLARALVVLMNWALNGAGQASLDAAGIIPVVDTEAAQSGFWAKWPAYAPVADWTHFQNFARGWPTAALAPHADSVVTQVLFDAVGNPAGLKASLNRAALTLNATLAQG